MQAVNRKSLLFGFLVWLIPFIVSVAIFPIRESSRALFESIMPVVITICVVVFAVLYFRRLEGSSSVQAAAVLGIVWFGISLVLDLLMFMWGPMKMTFRGYMMDIGLTYLMIPTITIGFGYLVRSRTSA